MREGDRFDVKLDLDQILRSELNPMLVMSEDNEVEVLSGSVCCRGRRKMVGVAR